MEADGAANAIKVLDADKYEELLAAAEGLEVSKKEQGTSFDPDSEEWKAVEQNVNVVLASVLPGIWPDSSGVIEKISACNEAKAELQKKIDALEGSHTCPKCRQDFQDSEEHQDAVPLPCPESQHFLCRACFTDQEDSFKCPSCRQAPLSSFLTP